jgi:choice-of-anchor B domain-containing protein
MPTKILSALVTFLVLLAPGSALAHGDREPPLYVATEGVDTGRCQEVAAPCASIGYALRQVGKGGRVLVASGTYAVTDAEDLFHLLSGDVNVQGGYSTADGFASATATGSFLTGVPPSFATDLSERGFNVIADRKGFDKGLEHQTSELLALHGSLQSSIPTTPCTDGSAGGLPCENVDLLSHVGMNDISAAPGAGADVWGFVDLNTNREYALAGFNIGTAVFDVTDPGNPREVGFIDGQNTSWRDIKVYQFWNDAESRWNAHAYITTDGSTDGLFVVDMSDLPHSVRRVDYPSDFSAAHNIYATNTDFGTGLSLSGATPTLVIAGSSIGDGPYRSYSISNPSAPAFEVMPGSGRVDYMHDAASMTLTDARKDQCPNATNVCELLFDFNELTFDIWDITDTANPVRLSQTNYPNVAYVHSGWWSEDKQYLFVHDELDERDFGLRTTLRVYSLTNLSSPSPAGQWAGPTTAIDHNGFARGNRYYMSNYSRGLTVLDITDSANPVAVGRLDTYPASDARAFVGAWGAYPYFHSGSIAISDINSGFYLAADRTLAVAQGSLEFSAPSYGGHEGDSLQIAVQRTAGSTGAVSVAYEIVPATGDSGDIDVTSGILSWADGDAGDKLITIDLLLDGVAEGIERALLRLVAPTGGATLAPGGVASLYIADAGTSPAVQFDRNSIRVAERGFATAVAVVHRAGSPRGAISVDYSLTAGDANPGADFSGATSGTISWSDGDADPRWIEFAIADDGVAEETEFFELTLANAVGADLGATPSLNVEIADGSGINRAPNSVAGANQTANSGELVTLNGQQSNDPDGDALTYAWAQTVGVGVTLADPTAATTSFTAPTVSSDTILRFELTVSDNGGLSSSSTTAVTVLRPPTPSGGGGGGGGAMNWLLLMLLAVILRKRVLPDNRLFAIRPRGDDVHRDTR